jgi:hypothetical protein
MNDIKTNVAGFETSKVDDTANIFKPSKTTNSKDFRHQTLTKWDSFEPRAFSKLSNRHKEEQFLQLFDDYIQIKAKLNE